jgi:hypothetical protein
MPSPANDRERDLKTLRNLIDEAHLILTTVGTAKGGANAAARMLSSALALTDDLLAAPSSAVSLGQRGGKKTAERGSEYFRQIAAKRKTKAGGRPPKPI